MKPPSPLSFRFWMWFIAGSAMVWVLGLVSERRNPTPLQNFGITGGRAHLVASDRSESGESGLRAPDSVSEELRGWLVGYEALVAGARAGALEKGLLLAQTRRERMLELIRSQPEAALEQAFGWEEVSRLPAEVRDLVEKPFSEVANYTSIPVCPGNGSQSGVAQTRGAGSLEFADGLRVEVFTAGAQQEIGSKRGLPVQGIVLDGVAAMRAGPFQAVTAAEFAVLATRFVTAQADPTRSFASGKPIAGEPVRAIAGGKLFSFADASELTQLNRALVKLDALPGPKPASSAIFALPYMADSASGRGFNLPSVQMAAVAAASEWTLTKKKFFLIRVDFSDKTGESVSKSAAETVLNGDVTSAISQMSYGNTSVTATVSANVYRLPQTAAYYAGTSTSGYAGSTFSSKNDELLAAARTAFRNAKSGLDAAINIGSGASGAANPLGDYDVVGVTFGNIGAYSSGLKFAGLASLGAGDYWIQNTNSANVYVHEFGHVYGLGHSNFWQTTDSSVVGAGSEKEYGDIYDVMGDGDLPEGHFHPQAKQRLSWINSSQWADATALGVTSKAFRIYRHDDSLTTGAIRGVRVTKSAPSAVDPEYYWIGYRAAYTQNAHLTGGAYLLWQRPGAEKCCLLDTTPLTSGDKSDAGLDIGRTYADTVARVYITPFAKGGSGSEQYLDVMVNMGSFTGNHPPVVGTLSGASTFGARSTVTFTSSATDADNDTLSYSWDAGDGTLSGGTGALASSFAHSYTVGGTYTLKVTVSDMKGGSVSKSQTVTVTDPALTFTQRTSGTTADISGVAASETLLVAVGQKGGSGGDSSVIRTSTDGITWTGRSVVESTLNLRLKAVTWDGLRFTAVGQDSTGGGFFGVIYTSENGLNWTRRYTAGAEGTSLVCVASGGGVLLAGGEAGTLLVSSDGLSWSSVSLLENTQSVGGIAYGNGTFALTAHLHDFGTGSGKMYTSSNGLSWTDRSAGMGIEDSYQDLRTIGFLNDRFVSSGWYSKVRVSTDGGQTFTSTRTLTEEVSVFGYGEGLYFVAGLERLDAGGTREVNLYSVDGVNWVQSVAAASVKARNGGLVFNNRLITVGESGQILQSDALGGAASNHAPVINSLVVPSSLSARSPAVFSVVASDADGDPLLYRWDAGDGTTSNTSSTFVHQWAVGGTFSVSVSVSDGKGGVVTTSQSVVVADPVQSFTQRTTGTTKSFNAMAANTSVAVAVGDNGQIWTSADGVTWSSRSITPVNLYFYGVIWDGSRFVLVGTDYSFTLSKWIGVIYTSDDALTWTKRYTASVGDTQLRAVASGAGVLLAGGDGALLLKSTDGLTWTPVSSITGLTSAHAVGGIAYGNGAFLLTAHTANFGNGDGRVYSSPDGVTWTNRTAGTGIDDSYQDLRSIAYLNDRFVANGWYSKLRVTTNNGVSFSTTRTPVEIVPALAYGNGVYFAGGQDKTAGTNVHVVSSDGEDWSQLSAASFLTEENAATFFKNTILVAGDNGVIGQSGVISVSTQVPEVLIQPSGASVAVGGSVKLSVVATGTGPLRYQWRKGAVAISGATLSGYVIPTVSLGSAGSYDVVVTNGVGSATSRAATVGVSDGSVPLGISAVKQPVDKAIVRGAAGSLEVAVDASTAPGVQTGYELVEAVSGALVSGVSGTVPPSGLVEVPLRGVKFSGSYFLHFVRTQPGGASVSVDSEAFAITVKGWEDAAGSYEGLVASANAFFGDGGVYRGLLSVTVTRAGFVSGKLTYNEAPLLAGGGTLGLRGYLPVTKSFVAELQPVPGVDLKFTCSPRFVGSALVARQEVALALDFSGTPATLSASVKDNVSIPGNAAVLSVVEAVERAPVNLGAVQVGDQAVNLRSVVGAYTLVSDVLGDPSGADNNAYTLIQVLPSGRVLWSSRQTGIYGSGATLVRASGLESLAAPFYEGRTQSVSSVVTTMSLLGQLNFTKNGAGRWGASFGSSALAGKLERQSTRTAVQRIEGVVTPVYLKAGFEAGTYGSGLDSLEFESAFGSDWSGVRLAEQFPVGREARLKVDATLGESGSGPFAWAVSFSSSRGLSVTGIAGTNGQMPPRLTLKIDKGTGQCLGTYVLHGTTRTLYGALALSEEDALLRARGWVESPAAGFVRKPPFVLWSLALAP